MKRLISLAIVCSTLLSLIAVPVLAIKPEQGDEIPPQMAQAYLEVINEIIIRYGVAINEDDTGLFYGELLDFQGDGQKELFLLYAEDEYGYRGSIWGFDGAKPYLIWEDTYQPGGTRTSGKLGLKQVGSKTYLCFEETDLYDDMINDELIRVESKSFKVQEVNGKQLQQTTYLYSLLHYDEDFKELSFKEYAKGTDYENKKPITDKEYEEIYKKFSLAEDEVLVTSVAAMYEYTMENYNLELFIDDLKDNLMSSNMKDIYSEQSFEEIMSIREFLVSLRFFYYNEYDISNPDQSVLAEFITALLSRNPDLLEHEYLDDDDDRYDMFGTQWKYKEEDVNRIAMELFGINIDFQKYSPMDYKNGYVYVYQPNDAEPLMSIKISSIYSLENGLFYIPIETYETWTYENEDIILNTLYEDLPSNIKQDFYQLRQGYAIIKEIFKDGKRSYQIIKLNTNDEYLTDDQLNKYISKVNPEPNVSFDYSKVKNFAESKEYINFFKDIISGLNGEKPNDKANGEIVTYIQHSIENSTVTTVKNNKNKVEIEKSIIEKALENGKNTKLEFDDILKNNDITLNKNIEVVLRINSESIDPNKTRTILFDSSIPESIGEANGIRVILGDNQHTVYVNSEDLKNIINEIGSISIHIQKDKDTGIYTIVFMDSDGTEINQLPYPISLSLPADNELASIFVNYKGGSDNWGGQYSSTTKSIEFSTRFSGEYSILENEINISDIEDLTDEQQKAIKFMVSKGYFGLEGDKFNGDGPLTRYDFTTALVKMFFALDRELETTFTDIEESNQYYPYIASGQKDDIVKGFEDNTFRGQINITKEQIIALCGRTLVDKKGYIYPENPKDYLGFVDSVTIADWATVDIAIAVQNGLIDNGGLLMPQMEISRNEGAEILYKLFMLLYDVPPVAVEIDHAIEITADSVEAKESSTSPVVIGGILAVLALGGGGLYLFRKKNTAK